MVVKHFSQKYVVEKGVLRAIRESDRQGKGKRRGFAPHDYCRRSIASAMLFLV